MTEPKPFIEYADWPKLTPFTEGTIRAAVCRGELLEGVHYFKRGRRVVFEWAACVEWIKGRVAEEGVEPRDLAPVRRRA